MPLTQDQISEFTRRARMAGLSDTQIQQEIEKKAREMGGATSPMATTGKPATSQTKQLSPIADEAAIPEEGSGIGGFVVNFVKEFVRPAVEYGKYVGEAGYQAGRFVFDPTFRKSVLGEKLTPEELEKLNSGKDTLFYTDEEAQKKLGDRGKIALTGAKATAGGMSYAIPFGKGAGIASKALLPGLVTGGLNEFSREGATPESVAESAVLGAGTAGALHVIGGMISWVRGKNGELIREGENLAKDTRKIKVKASVYGAGKEKAINQTLDKYGFKGSAQDQYEMLEPVMKEIEEKIQTVIKDNPSLAVSKESIRDAFMENLKSSLRSKDLTQRQAVKEIEGYLNDLLRASGEVGAETGQSLLKAGEKDIPLATLREMKKLLNQDYAGVFKKLENGTSLNAREKVIAAAWDSLDEAVKSVSPEVKNLLLDESNLYKASQSLSSARFNPPTLRVAGTSLPPAVTQKVRDLGAGLIKKLGLGLEKLPEGTVLQQPTLEKLAAMTPAILRERGLTDEEIGQVTEIQAMLTAQPTGTESLTTTPTTTGTQPSALNPFGGLTKRQVLALALSSGASSSDLKEVGEIYDMLASDPNVVDEETRGVADSLRTEYFKRTNENGFLDVANAYSKVLNTSETAAGDVSLIFAFMKMLDPGSVVREGEFATAEQTAGIPQQIVQQYNKALSGRRLSKQQRQSYRKEAARVFQVYQSRQAPIDAYYQGLAQKYGIDPSLVGVGLYTQ